MQHLRGSGRTTRMLTEAIDAAKRGENVWVIAATAGEAKRLFDEAVKITGVEGIANLPISFRKIPAASMGVSSLDWYKMALQGVATHSLFVDHFAIESEFGKMVEMLHRWDETPTQQHHESPCREMDDGL